MKTLTTYDKASLTTFPLKELVDINNELAKVLKAKPTKRFGSKDAAIKAVLKKQNEYLAVSKTVKTNATAKKSAPKKAKNSFKPTAKFELDTQFVLGSVPAKEETAMGHMVKPLAKGKTATAKVLMNHFLKTFSQKRGLATLDEGFARGYLAGALRAKHLKIVK